MTKSRARQRTKVQPRRLAVESLEDRRLLASSRALGSIAGTVFDDQNGDGVRAVTEPALRGWVVYGDRNNNGRLDRGEPAAASGRDGSYRLAVAPGTYTIREVAPTEWQVTSPIDGSYPVSVAAGSTVTGKDFGNQKAVATVSGTVFNDLDSDGNQETDAEPVGKSDFQITLSFSGLTASQQAIAEQAADRWEQVIVGDLPDVRYRGQTIDDVSINIRTQRMDGVGNVLGESGPEAVRTGRDGLPYLGTVVIDTADIAQMESGGQLLTVLTHEIAHVLGFGTLWTSQGLLSGTRTSNPLFIGSQAVAEYNKAFGTNATGVPVEAGGGTGTALGHWRLSVFGNELMVGYIQDGDMPLSSITVAAMADLGYEVNPAAADDYSPLAASSSPASAASSASGSTGSSVSTSGGGATTPTRVPGTVAAAPGPSWQHNATRPWGSDSRTTSGHSFASSRWQAWPTAVDDVFAMAHGWV